MLERLLIPRVSQGGSDSKESACNVGDPGLIPGLKGFLGEGSGYPLKYSCPENSMDKEPSRLRGFAESNTTE